MFEDFSEIKFKKSYNDIFDDKLELENKRLFTEFHEKKELFSSSSPIEQSSAKKFN